MREEGMDTEQDKHISAYERMLDRVRLFLHETREDLGTGLQHAIESAKEQAVHLGEISKDEGELISTYLRRDLHDMGNYLQQQSGELADWLRFDVKQVEQRVWEALSLVVDKSRIELDHFKRQAHHLTEWHTGEITSPGTLICTQCGEVLHFHNTGRIPPCPKCHTTIFHRRN
jgi:NADH pyrophosphatase NudC (nudix superfamily)